MIDGRNKFFFWLKFMRLKSWRERRELRTAGPMEHDVLALSLVQVVEIHSKHWWRHKLGVWSFLPTQQVFETNFCPLKFSPMRSSGVGRVAHGVAFAINVFWNLRHLSVMSHWKIIFFGCFSFSLWKAAHVPVRLLFCSWVWAALALQSPRFYQRAT